MKISLFILALLWPLLSIAEDLSLKQVLQHQFKDSEQSQWVSDKIESETSKNTISYSAWFTEISTSLEKRIDYTERITGSLDNVTSNLPWISTVTQKTPYGLSLKLEYYKEMASPNFKNFFQDEKLRGQMEMSLINDFLGIKTRNVINNQKSVNDVYEIKTKADICQDVSKKYIKAALLQEKVNIASESLANSKKILTKLKGAVHSGALNKTAHTSMTIDVGNLNSEFIVLKKDLNESNIELEKTSGLPINGRSLKSILKPQYKTVESKYFLSSEVLKQEIKNLNSQIDVLKLNSQRDLALFAGVDSSKFTQNTINIEGETRYSFVGVKAKIQFGDENYNNEKKRLKSQLQLKEYELRLDQVAAKQKEALYIESLKNLNELYNDLSDGIKESTELERRSYRNFYSGNTSYFDFLSTRNQIYSFKRSLVDTKAQFWETYVDYFHLKGNLDELCFHGSGL